MEKETEKFLEAEKTAQELASTLGALSKEIASYQTAGQELEAVRRQLSNLTDSTKDVVARSHDLLSTLKEIGGPEILGRLAELDGKLSETAAKQAVALGRLRLVVLAAFVSSVVGVVLGIVGLII